MIRFAPQPVPTRSTQSAKAKTNMVNPLEAADEISVVMSTKLPEASEGLAESGMLLAELPEVSAKPSKTRSPRKPKAKRDTASAQLDLNA